MSPAPDRKAILRAMIEVARCLRFYRVSTGSIDRAAADYATFLAMIFSSRRYRMLRALIDREGGGWAAEAHLHCVIEPAALNLLTAIRAAGSGRDDAINLSRADLVKAIRFVEAQAAAADLRDPAALARLTGQMSAYIRTCLQSFAFITAPTGPNMVRVHPI